MDKLQQQEIQNLSLTLYQEHTTITQLILTVNH